MADAKYKEIKVTMEVSFLVPMHDDVTSKVNGWTVDEVKDDWFVQSNINFHHFARDASQIGGSKKILNIEIVDPDAQQV
jgi:hypothetical protein